MELLTEGTDVVVGGLMEVILHVKDMNAQVEFYRDKLGLRVTWPQRVSDYTKEGWVTFETGACVLALHGGGRTRHGESPSHRIVFRVDDIHRAREKLLNRGVSPGEIRSPAPEVFVFEGKDPEGNILSFEAGPHH